MLDLPRKAIAAALLGTAALLAACGSDSPTDPGAQPPTGITATAVNATTIRLSFTGRAGDQSYTIERAPGGSATFAQVAAPAAPASGGQVTYDDAGLDPSTQYSYRVAAVRNGLTSAVSAAVSASTAAPGTALRDVTQDIAANAHWTADTVYTLKGFIHVKAGATLTIDAGTTIKGDYATLGSSLFVLRGAKIVAVGTATNPIVFTSSQPAGQRKPGDWGGLILVGNGIDNRSGNIEVEGTNTDASGNSGTNYQVLYSGGTDNDDSSGELKYVRVEFAGYAPSTNNELNSFSFAAVGKGTKLSYLQSMAGLDDSFEFWGGAADADHLVSYESGDDHFDMSEGFKGRLQYLIAFQSTQLAPRTGAGSFSSDPEGIENDGCAGTGCDLSYNSTPFTIPVIANFTLVGTGSTASAGSGGGYGMVLRRGTGGYYVNGIVARWPRAAIAVRDQETYDRAGDAATPDLATTDLALRNILTVESAATFQSGTGIFSFDLAGNAITASNATTGSLFTAFPATVDGNTTEAAFDWTPAAGSAAASTAGLATFAGKLATAANGASAAGNTVAGTSYVGAVAPGGAKWWAGWTKYYQK